MENKRGQVNVIVVILIILIAFVAVMIVWNIVVPLIREEGEDVIIEPLVVKLEVKEVILFTNGALKVSVERGAGRGEITGLNFVFYDELGGSHVETKETAIEELETEIHSFSPVPVGKIKEVSVVPVFGKKMGREFKSGKPVLELPAGLVSWWRFDDTQDFVGDNHGDFANIIDDERGKVASFSGTAMNVGNSADLSVRDKIAISFWIKPSLDQGSIIKKGANYEVSLNGGQIDFSSILSYGSVELDEWTHVVVSVDWAGTSYASIYINGENKGGNSLGAPDINNENVLIGENFQGSIDELMFFNKALSHLEAEGLFNNQK
jgi:hypothetical protein